MSNDSETSEGTISEFQDLLKTEMSDWDKYFSFKDDGYLFWGTNFHESFIYLYLEIDEDDSEDVDIYIGLLNLHPRKNKFSKLKESYYTIDDPEYFADNWEWDCSESEIFYSTTIELGEFVNNLGWIREGLLQWQSFLSLNGLRLAKPE
ncbi:hypothetical protein CCR91_17595 [Thiorhodovibrio winogradskyi]|nr:hypothetical protein [Thiorhodovibrio winogradskyi]